MFIICINKGNCRAVVLSLLMCSSYEHIDLAKLFIKKSYVHSSLKKLAEKGCWDIAEIKTNNERPLLEYLVKS